MATTLICNGTVVDPSQGLHGRFDLLVENGEVRALLPAGSRVAADTTIDARGMIVAPGFIDLHAHLREPGSEGCETIESGTRAAAAGGFTTVYAMANTNPVCDTLTGVHYVLSRAANVGSVRVVPIAAVTIGQKGEQLTNFGILKEAGAGAFSDNHAPIMNADILRRAMEYARMLNVTIFDHCQDLNLTGDGVMHEGAMSLRLGLRGIPRVAESVMVARDVALSAATGGHVHISHVSARESVECIREAKRNGVPVTAATTPHHLTMTDRDCAGYNTMAKMIPPLCAEEDRAALIAALEDGTIDCIATNHAPHGAMEKNRVFDGAPFGVIGFETSFPVLYTEFVSTGRWSIDFLIERLTVMPSKVVGQRWGTLETGTSADIVLIQPDVEYVFEERHLRSKSRNSPFIGRTVRARIAATLYGGRLVFENPDANLSVKHLSEPAPPVVVQSAVTVKPAARKAPAKKPARKGARTRK